ncbi:hypothetical protein NCCP2165_09280 [Halomonas sp. NCCP-2165]|nr:hypothetical protein NCCP2165_09280 [Halomonas sp. NCCP-2165]
MTLTPSPGRASARTGSGVRAAVASARAASKDFLRINVMTYLVVVVMTVVGSGAGPRRPG